MNHQENPFDGLSDNNKHRMSIYLTLITRKMTSSEVYQKYGYSPPLIGIDEALRIAADIAQNGIIIN